MNASGSSRRKRRRDEVDEADDLNIKDGFMDDETEPHKFGTAVLPVADLPDSFDGIPQNGMEYLFTVRREGKRLPLVTRVHNPYSEKDAVTEEGHRDDTGTTRSRSTLPSEEWRLCFEERFQNFRANIQQPTIHISLPRTATPSHQIPEMRERDRWWAFFRGDINWDKIPSFQSHNKKSKSNQRTRKQVIDYEEELPKNTGKLRGWAIYDEQLSWGEGNDDAPVSGTHSGAESKAASRAEDAEHSQKDKDDAAKDKGKGVAADNALPIPDSVNQIAVDIDTAMRRELTPREPTPELLNLLDQKVTFHLLKFFAQWIQAHFDPPFLPAPPQNSEVCSSNEHRSYNLTPTHARWIFALLSRLDERLTSDEISALRKLAREIIRVMKEELSCKESFSCTSSIKSSMGVAACWVIVGAIACTWRQTDLWMDAEEALR